MLKRDSEKLNLDEYSKENCNRILSADAKDCFNDPANDLGYRRCEDMINFYHNTVHPLRVFGVLSLLTAESKAKENGGVFGFAATEVQKRHQQRKNVGDYTKVLQALTQAGLVAAKDGTGPTIYTLHVDVDLGPAFEDATQAELDQIVVTNEEIAESPDYIVTLLPGMGDLVTAASNDRLFERPGATGWAALSVGAVLSLVAVLQFATPGVTPSDDLLMGAWLILSVGLAAGAGGLLRWGELRLHDVGPSSMPHE